MEIWKVAMQHDNAPAHQTQLVPQHLAKHNIHTNNTTSLPAHNVMFPYDFSFSINFKKSRKFNDLMWKK
jgi:hypothetical protein